MTFDVNTIFLIVGVLILVVLVGFIAYVLIDRKINSITPNVTTDLYMSIDKEIDDRIKINLCNKEIKSMGSYTSSGSGYSISMTDDNYTIGDQTVISV